jgi:hypothetical protein
MQPRNKSATRPASRPLGPLSLFTRHVRLVACCLLLVTLSSCTYPWSRTLATPMATLAPPPSPATVPIATTPPSSLPQTPEPTPAPPPPPTPAPATRPTPSPVPTDLSLAPADVAVFPGPEHYSGDVVTFDVQPQNLGAIDPNTVEVRIYRGSADSEHVVAAGLANYYSFDGVPRARMVWSWDTAGLVGEQTLIAWLDPDDTIQSGDEDPTNNLVTFTVDLLPSYELPAEEADADWVSTTLPCCVFHYLDDASAGRDMLTITVVTEAAVAQVEAQMGMELPYALRFYLIERVIGHGGYAFDAVVLSYLDRHYAGFDLAVVVRHEATHVLDSLWVTVYPPAMLREGLATYMGGGHFKPEPIPQRSAALLELGYYIPLQQLVSDFYRQQHEVGYLEAAGLVSYLIQTYGWERFRTFYAAFPDDGSPLSQQLDAAMTRVFGQGLAATEEDFRAWLRALPPDPTQVRDLRDTVALFDTIRRYQAADDPSAYWMSGFLANPAEGEQRGIVADFVRHPRTPENIALETMLIAARERLRAGDFDEGEALVAEVNRVLDTGDWSPAPASDYLAIVQAVAAAGYEAQQIDLDGDTARVAAIAVWPELEVLILQRVGAGWK